MPLPTSLILTGLGGAVGAACRWAVLAAVPAGWAVVATVAVNVAGSLLAGALLGSGLRTDRPAWPLAVTGFCGGFTTFSAFAVHVAVHLREGRVAAAAVLVAATVATAVPAAGLGWWAAGGGRRR